MTAELNNYGTKYVTDSAGDGGAEARESLAFMHELADIAARVTHAHFRTVLDIDSKPAARFDPVTIADRDAEAHMREAIEARYPADGILGEEFGVTREGAARRWVLDPVDGTHAFICGLPMWGTLIGLERGGTPWLGMMDQPITGERFWGDGTVAHMRWRGATQQLSARGGVRLADAVLAATSPEMFKPGTEATRFAALVETARLTRYGADCYGYCMLAAGFIDIVAEASLKPYDIVALIPIIQGAGGTVTTWAGGDAAGGGRILAAGSAQLHAETLRVLAD